MRSYILYMCFDESVSLLYFTTSFFFSVDLMEAMIGWAAGVAVCACITQGTIFPHVCPWLQYTLDLYTVRFRWRVCINVCVFPLKLHCSAAVLQQIWTNCCAWRICLGSVKSSSIASCFSFQTDRYSLFFFCSAFSILVLYYKCLMFCAIGVMWLSYL